MPLHESQTVNEVWSMDFVSDGLASGRRNEHWFQSLKQARVEIARWRIHYNEERPHSSCGRMPPAKFAAQHRQTTGSAVPTPLQTQE